MTEHPITPPRELMLQWIADSPKIPIDHGEYIATQAARWGADQELEECDKALRKIWQMDHVSTLDDFLRELRAARRPKLPTLKEQALAELDLLKGDANAHGLGFDAPAILRALMSLPDEP